MSRRYRETPKSEMDSQRDLLDTLMGVNRNMDREEDEIHDYNDDRVCKFYLTGVCSHGEWIECYLLCLVLCLLLLLFVFLL